MPEESEPDFTFVDRRRVSADGDGAASPAPKAEVREPAVEDELDDVESGAPDLGMELPALGMRDRLLMCIDILHQGAWIAMGMVADPATGEINRDLPACKKAIDACEYLAKAVMDDVDDRVKREVQSVVSNLQINYVNQIRK